MKVKDENLVMSNDNLAHHGFVSVGVKDENLGNWSFNDFPIDVVLCALHPFLKYRDLNHEREVRLNRENADRFNLPPT